ncbi:MAG: hypothetical protein BWZ10_03215 [candidate division BRC1 bacterium ADurb.BinA364]|nr:MAG: hypothetical protein BWZ10_03215 [candidate division BRC1 bacterium ADurb.BinA364]
MFVAQSLPPYGYRCYRIEPAAGGGDAPLRAAPGAVSISRDGVRLENDRLRLLIDPAKGTIQSLFDKRAGREAVPPGGSLNRLESYESGGGGGAWHFGRILSMEALEEPVSLRVVESGPERATVEFKRRFRQSPITQRISLAAGSPLVDFEFTVDWKELGQYGGSCPSLRIAMDADLATTPAATYEIPFGSIERPLSDGEQVALKWADLSDGEYGISLLNDSKHGYVAQGRTLRLTLVRSSAMPDPAPDQYVQTIRYALYPHAGDWRDAGTIALAAALNHPVVACAVPAPSGEARGLPAELSFVQIDAANLAIAGIKRAEDDDDLVVRLYESAGRATDARLATAWPIAGAVRTNFIEDTIGEPVKAAGGSAKVAARPHEIQTLKLQLRPVAGVVLSGTRGPGPARDFQD